MTTKELLAEAKKLLHAGDEAGLDRLIAENQNNELFISIIDLWRKLIPAIIEVWREHGLLLDEEPD